MSNLPPDFFLSILQHSQQAILACDENQKINFLNEKARILHGIPANVTPGLCEDHFQFFEIDGITPTKKEKHPLARALAGEELREVFHFILKSDKTSVLVKYTGSVLRDNEGKVIGAMISGEECQSQGSFISSFVTIFEQSPLSIQIFSADGKTLKVNKAFQELWSISDEFINNFILKEYNILYDPILEKSGRLERIRRAFKGEIIDTDEFYYDPAEHGLPGRGRWARGTVYPLKNAFGEVTEVVIIHQDKTDQKNIQLEKENLFSQLEALVKQIPAGIMLQDKKGTVGIYNEQMRKLVGDPSEAKNIFNDSIENALKGNTLTSHEVKHYSASGNVMTLLTSSGPIQNSQDEITSSIIIASDISKDKRRESHLAFLTQVKSLLISTINYESMLDRIAGATIPYLADGCMVDILEGDTINRIISKHHNPEIQGYLDELLKNYPPTLNSPQPGVKVIRSGAPDIMKVVDEQTILRHTWDERHAELIQNIGIRSHISVPLKIRGKTIGAISIYLSSGRTPYDEHDFAVAQELARHASVAIDNAKLHQEAQQAVKLRDEFISMASHELKTPITSLNLQVEVLNDLVSGLESDTEVSRLMTKFLGSTNKQLMRLSRLVDDMLDISRISSGKLSLSIKETNLTMLTHEIHERFKDQLKDLKINSQLHLGDNIKVHCDPERIDQVITNFMTNAIRYGGRSPIHMTIEDSNQKVIFKIKDHGRGIKKEDQERIFKRFERAHTHQDVDGLGLGLYINKQIIDEHNGLIKLESEEGQGATFIFELLKSNT